VLPRRHEPDLAGLAVFTQDPGGRVVSWSLTATALFGYQAGAAIGHDVCDVLMTGLGQRELVRRALGHGPEAAAVMVQLRTAAPSRSPTSASPQEPPSRCTPTGWWKAAAGPLTTDWPRSAVRSAPSWAGPAAHWTAPARGVTQLLREHGEDDITLMLARTRQAASC